MGGKDGEVVPTFKPVGLYNVVENQAEGDYLIYEARDSDTLQALSLDGENVNLDWPAIKREIVRIAKHEFEVVWDRGRKQEDEASVRSVLLDYYEVGVGMSREAILEELHLWWNCMAVQPPGSSRQLPVWQSRPLSIHLLSPHALAKRRSSKQ